MANSKQIVCQRKRFNFNELKLECTKVFYLRSKPDSQEPKNWFPAFLAKRVLPKIKIFRLLLCNFNIFLRFCFLIYLYYMFIVSHICGWTQPIGLWPLLDSPEAAGRIDPHPLHVTWKSPWQPCTIGLILLLNIWPVNSWYIHFSFSILNTFRSYWQCFIQN